MGRALMVLTVAFTVTGYAAASIAKDVPPFEWRFQVTSVTLKSTFTNGPAAAVTELHLTSLPKPRSLDWYGKRGVPSFNGEGVTVLHLSGTITYSGLDAAACNGTVKVDSSRWRPIYAAFDLTNARDPVVTHPTLYVSPVVFPFGTTNPRPGGGCENGATSFYLNAWPKPDTGPAPALPLAVVHRPGFTIANTYHEQFDDGSGVQWSAAITVRRIHYLPIDCSRTQNC